VTKVQAVHKLQVQAEMLAPASGAAALGERVHNLGAPPLPACAHGYLCCLQRTLCACI